MAMFRGSPLAAGAWLITVPLAGVAAARLVRFDNHPFLAMANAGTPFLYLPAWGALAVGVAQRRTGLSALAAGVVAAHVTWTAPELRRRRPLPETAAGAPRLRIVSANIRFTRRDATSLGYELDSLDPDILLLQELAPEHLTSIKEAGALDAFPYSYVDARPRSFGAGIWSRYPLSDGDTWYPAGLPMVRATVDVDGRRLRIINIHIKAPMRRRWIPTWKAQLRALGEEVQAARTRGPVVLAGDFNSTYGHAPFRELLAQGLRDAHVEVGRGLAVTWPRGGRVMPPLFRIDHVLVSDGLAVLDAREGRGPGSDHRPVIVDLAVLAPGAEGTGSS
jgi:endonuclease/exonuclease/phosphatase (EEP) superfamily protein YafD